MDINHSLILNAMTALYGAVGPNLYKFSVEIFENTIFCRFIVNKLTSDSELEDYRIVATEIMACYNDLLIDDEFITVDSIEDIDSISDLAIRIFCIKH